MGMIQETDRVVQRTVEWLSFILLLGKNSPALSYFKNIVFHILTLSDEFLSHFVFLHIIFSKKWLFDHRNEILTLI